MNYSVPDAEEGCENRSINLGEVVVAVVDRLQLVQLGERVPRDLQQLVECLSVYYKDMKWSWRNISSRLRLKWI